MSFKDIHDLDPTRAPSVFDVDVLRIARVYAQALLRAAIKANKIDEFQESFDSLVGNPLEQQGAKSDVASLLSHGDIPRSKKEEVFRKVFEGKTEPLFLNFLLVLNKHNRLDLLRPTATMYRELRDEHYKRVRVLVRSATPLNDEQRALVRQLAETQFKLQPVLVEQIDAELLGGMQVQVGDKLIDLSVRGRLESLKNQLIERGTHEIQRRRDRLGPAV